MLRSLETLEEPFDVVQIDPLAKPEIARPHLERQTATSPLSQAGSDRIIHHGFQRATGASAGFPQAIHDIVFQGERGALRHVMKPNTRAS